MTERDRHVGEHRWLWPVLATPGVVWLLLLFVVPFYAILAIAMGRLDPIFSSAEPVWNPIQWNPEVFGELAGDLFGGQTGRIFLRTISYVAIASVMCIMIGYPVAYYISRHSG